MFHHVFLFAIILSSIIDDQHNLVCITANNELFLKFMHTYTNIPFGALSLDNQRPVFFFILLFFCRSFMVPFLNVN